MARRSQDSSAAKQARKARRDAKRNERTAGSESRSAAFPSSSHIKRNTHGTSNEISFSVLDAMKNAGSATTKKAAGVASTPRTMAEVAAEQARDEAHASLGISSSADDAARKSPHARPGARRVALFMGVCACAVALVIGMIAFLANMPWEEEDQVTLAPALTTIEQADSTLFAFDGIVVHAMNATIPEMIEQGTPARYEDCKPTLASAQERMREADELIVQAQPALTEEADREAADQMLATLAARTALIAAGEAAMDEAVSVTELYECVDQGWNDLLESDALARDAAVLSTYTTLATLQTALDKTDEAIAAFEGVRAQFVHARDIIATQRDYQARVRSQQPSSAEGGAPANEPGAEETVPTEAAETAGAISEATSTAPSPDQQEADPAALAQLDALDSVLVQYLDYIELRLNAQYEAKRSTQALIDHDSATAQEANDAYNQLDSRAVALIRGNVEQPTEYVIAYFEDIREALFSPYVQARARASEADAYLGDYLTSLGR